MLSKLLTHFNIHLYSDWYHTITVVSNEQRFTIENRVCFICGKVEERMIKKA